MSDEIRPTCEPNEPIAFLDWLEAQIAIEHEAVSPPPFILIAVAILMNSNP